MPSAFRGAEWCTAPIITISPRLALRAATSNDDASEPLCKDERSADDDPFDLLACAKLCAAHSMGLDECLIARGSVGSVSLEAAIRRSHRRLVTSFGDRVQVLGTTPNGVSRTHCGKVAQLPRQLASPLQLVNDHSLSSSSISSNSHSLGPFGAAAYR